MKRALLVAAVVIVVPVAVSAQRPSDPALLVPQEAPELAYVAVANPVTLPPGVEMGPSASAAFNARGDLYVLNRGMQPIMQFDAAGKYVRGFGQGLFTRSHGIHVDAEGNIWATDVADHLVYKLSPEGKVLLTIGTKGKTDVLNEPTDVVVARNGDVYVSQGHVPGTGGDARISRFDKTGKLIKTWGRKGTGPGEFNVPHGIAIDAKNQVWVTDREGQRVEIFDANGTFLRELKYKGLPSGLHIGRDYIYLVNGFAGQILRLDLEGKVLAATGKPGPPGPGQFGEAHYITVSPTGDLWVSDPSNRLLQKFVPRQAQTSTASSDEQQILSTLQTLYAAYPKRDGATLERIYHKDLIYTHSSGSMDDKTAHLADVLLKRVWESVTIKSSTVRVEGSAAVVRAVMDIRNGPTADRLRTDADRNVTLFLLKGAQGWQVVLRQ